MMSNRAMPPKRASLRMPGISIVRGCTNYSPEGEVIRSWGLLLGSREKRATRDEDGEIYQSSTLDAGRCSSSYCGKERRTRLMMTADVDGWMRMARSDSWRKEECGS